MGWRLNLSLDAEGEIVIKVPPSAEEQVIQIRRPLFRNGGTRLGGGRQFQIKAADEVKIGRKEREAYVPRAR